VAELWAIGLVILGTLSGAFGPLLLKKGADLAKHDFFKGVFFRIVPGGFFYVVGTSFFIIALKGGDLSVLYPFVSTSYIFVSLLSMKYLGEKMTKYKWIGIGSIIIGITFIGFGA